MNVKLAASEEVVNLADKATKGLSAIADAAKSEAAGLSKPPTDVLANLGTSQLASSSAGQQSIAANWHVSREANKALLDEPAIARVVTATENGDNLVYYVCRATPPTIQSPRVVSQRALLGRLASLRIGEALERPDGVVLTVVDRAELFPRLKSQVWDSLNTVYQWEGRVVTIPSLLDLLASSNASVPTDDLLALMLQQDDLSGSVIEGRRRSVLTAIQLRDQPVLDSTQDAIFRLPLNSQQFLCGPPGSGKTTTLIRRLGQKLDLRQLPEDEQNMIERARSLPGSQASESSWLMFTPTELLKQYLKEAFNKERIPAPESNVRTWSDYSREISRSELSILRSTAGRGRFILRSESFTVGDEQDSIAFFEDFNAWQAQLFIEGLRSSAAALAESKQEKIESIGMVIQPLLARAAPVSDLLISLERPAELLRGLVDDSRSKVDEAIKGGLNLRLRKDASFLERLGDFVAALEFDEEIEDDDLDVEPDDEEASPTRLASTVRVYGRAVRTHARALASGRKLRSGSASQRVMDWVGIVELGSGTLEGLGKEIILQAHARRLITSVRGYLHGIPRRYRRFRRQRHKEEKWFASPSIVANDISTLELDVLILCSLKAATTLWANGSIRAGVTERFWSALVPYGGLLRNLIFVDEVSDFSPLQVSSMALLANPITRSFFASGDFNQRLTVAGLRSLEQFEWSVPGVKMHLIETVYRQSQRLRRFANELLSASEIPAPLAASPEGVVDTEVKPVAIEYLDTTLDVASWIAARIREVERSLQTLPSIAVFVPSEEDVEPLARVLDDQLKQDNLRAVACTRGQIKGLETDVRVFDIQHVKGLEFEAVFFVAVDELSKKKPDLYTRFLYVGATRAATYLGVTCSAALPSPLSGLRDSFTTDWRDA